MNGQGFFSMNDDFGHLTHLRYEDAYAKLEKIVAQLETSSLPLDESLRLFEEGQKLSAYCQQLLDKAELQVTKLINGTFEDISPSPDEDKSAKTNQTTASVTESKSIVSVQEGEAVESSALTGNASAVAKAVDDKDRDNDEEENQTSSLN
jgi:exodeoxyribonuclease VII small subunit